MEDQDIRFSDEQEAIDFCKEHGLDFVFKSEDPEHADAPFFALKYEWLSDIMVVNDDTLH